MVLVHEVAHDEEQKAKRDYKRSNLREYERETENRLTGTLIGYIKKQVILTHEYVNMIIKIMRRLGYIHPYSIAGSAKAPVLISLLVTVFLLMHIETIAISNKGNTRNISKGMPVKVLMMTRFVK